MMIILIIIVGPYASAHTFTLFDFVNVVCNRNFVERANERMIVCECERANECECEWDGVSRHEIYWFSNETIKQMPVIELRY